VKYGFHAKAHHEFQSAADWYEARRKGLGVQFRMAVSNLLEAICKHPDLAPEIAFGIRKCKTRRFPYIVYYRRRDDVVEVLAVSHARRRPGYWLGRVGL
jgi:plasmid stabilization system protein ParE